MKEGNTIRRTLEEIRERRRKGINDIDWERVNAMTDDEIERLALQDNRHHGIDDEWYKGTVRATGLAEVLALEKRDQDRNGNSRV